MTYEVGSGIGFRAQHVMPGAQGPEGSPHSHDYELRVVIRTARLDGAGMVCDLDVLNRLLEEITAELDGSDLERIRPPHLPAVTVEALAQWAHERLSQGLEPSVPAEMEVRVYENPIAFGGYTAPLGSKR